MRARKDNMFGIIVTFIFSLPQNIYEHNCVCHFLSVVCVTFDVETAVF